MCHHVRMRTWTLLSQKGGSGKTTLALNLAIAASLEGREVVVIDIDPQQSAIRWSRLRLADRPVFASGHGPNLPTLIDRAREGGADLVIVDTAPKSESAALAAAKHSDLVVIPCQPSSLDLDAVADSVNIVRLARVKGLFVLNHCRATSPLADDAAEALADMGLPIAPVRVGCRVAFVKSLAEGQGVLEFEPKGAAAEEIQRLFKHVAREGGLEA